MTGALCAKAKPSAVPRNGAVQGVASVVASTPLKNAPARAVLRGEFARRVQRASAERDFKHAEQIQRHERDERGEADDEDRAAELHSPAGVMPGGLDADDDPRQRQKRHQHAERIDKPSLRTRRGSLLASLTKPRIFSAMTGSTHGMMFRINPPMKA